MSMAVVSGDQIRLKSETDILIMVDTDAMEIQRRCAIALRAYVLISHELVGCVGSNPASLTLVLWPLVAKYERE